MLKALLRARMQALLASMFSRTRRKKHSPIGKLGILVLVIYVTGALAFSVGALCFELLALADLGLDWLYFALIALAALALCLFGGCFISKSTIFEARDNELLLSMPIPSGALLTARLLPLFAVNALYGAVLILPAGVVWLWHSGGDLKILYYLLCSLLLILLGTALSALLGWGVSALTAHSRRKSLWSTVFALVFLGFYFVLCFNMSNYLNTLLAHGHEIADALRRSFPPIFWFGKASIGDLGSLALLALTCLLPALLVFLLLRCSLLRIMTGSRAAARVEYKRGPMQARTPFATLFRKELHRLFSSSTYLLNSCLGSVMLIAGSVLFVVKGKSLTEAIAAMGLGSELPLALAAVLFGFCTSMLLPSSCAISLEGRNYPLLRSMPISSRTLFAAKIAVPLSFGLPCSLIAGLILGLGLGMPTATTCALIFFGCAMTLLMSVFGLLINLLMPKMDWYNEAMVVKQSGAVLVTMLGGMSLVAAPALLWMLALQSVPLTGYLFAVGGVYLLLTLGCLLVLRFKGETLLAQI